MGRPSMTHRRGFSIVDTNRQNQQAEPMGMNNTTADAAGTRGRPSALRRPGFFVPRTNGALSPRLSSSPPSNEIASAQHVETMHRDVGSIHRHTSIRRAGN
jgi:hypothetical protein